MKNLTYFCITLLSITLLSCSNKGKLPTVQTGQYTIYPETKTVQCEGYVETDGGDVVVERGICYNAGGGSPTVADHRVSAGSGKGSFTAVLTDISEGDYTYCAFATNAAGTAYGEPATFTMSPSGSSGGGDNPGGGGGGDNPGGGDQPQGNYLMVKDNITPIASSSFQIVYNYAVSPSFFSSVTLRFFDASGNAVFYVGNNTLAYVTSVPVGTWTYSDTWSYDECSYLGWGGPSLGSKYYAMTSMVVSRNGNIYTVDCVINSTSKMHYQGPISITTRTEYNN